MKKTTKKTALMRPAKIVDSAQQIWLAGLGAFAMAGEEGKDLFAQLVRRGHDVQQTGRTRIEKAVKTAGKRAGDLREDAQAMLGRVRLPVDRGVAKAMHRFGIPTRTEIHELTRRVEALTKAVQKKNGAKKAHKAPAAATTA
jgi:poly(hydroxyalkanoate) granule-associated protein